jgi:superfamily II DNA/RNA helicase
MQNFSVDTILSNMKIDKLNEMQLAAMDAGQKDNDMVLLSATGSGKTIAFLMPIVAQLEQQKHTGYHRCTIARIGAADRAGFQKYGHRL